MKFDYLQRVVIDAQLDVENIGECCLLGRNDIGEEWYLVIHSMMGVTEVIEYGPIVPDLNLLPSAVTLKYSRFDYNQGKIERIIDKFLNDGQRAISQAEVTDFETVSSNIVNPVDRLAGVELMRGNSNENN